MTKKHFEAAAAQIRGNTTLIASERAKVCYEFCEFFASFNPRFDVERFRKACGVV